jgi:adenine-specific DNA methylase
LINEFAQKASTDKEFAEHCSPENWVRWQTLARNGGLGPKNEDHWNVLRNSLLDFIADFSNWDNSTVPEYLATSRALTQSAHEALGGAPGTKPLVVDPFAGGGSIPLEALRVGADAFAGDLNPVAVLLNKVVLEYLPKYGARLVDEVRKSGGWINREAQKELCKFYPKDLNGATPIAYLWARTIQCEGPGCGAEVPLLRSLWLAKRANRFVALQLVPRPTDKRVDFRIIVKQRGGWIDQDVPRPGIEEPRFDGTVKRGSATCPCCGYTTAVARVREQLKAKRGGANDARLLCVVTLHLGGDVREYRLAQSRDADAFKAAQTELARINSARGANDLSPVPDEKIPPTEIRRISVPIYGMTSWGDLFSARQALSLSTLVKLAKRAGENLTIADPNLARAVTTVLGLAVSRFSDICNALCMWETSKTQVRHMFTRQAIGMLWDYAEPNIFADAAGNFSVTLGTMLQVLERESIGLRAGQIARASATDDLVPEASADAVITDPPYYDAVPYAHLSDFFYVWLRRSLREVHPDLFMESEVPKTKEIVVDRPHELSQSVKDASFYERELTSAFTAARRVLRHNGIGTIVFASKTTASWEAMLKAVVDAGWVVTGSWPIDTELENRLAAQGQARLASSIHLVCRVRQIPKGSVPADQAGDWRDVLAELPKRIHDWMPRLSAEGVTGADAIFACLGPALEIFSRYSRVERASGEQVKLKDYLESVWAAVAKEALNMIFKGADATGFEEDARLTAMWLWTLSTGTNGSGADSDEPEDGEEENSGTKVQISGFILEYDAARKIAQGLGAHLEQLTSLVEINGDKARLLPISERAHYLFGKDEGAAPTKRKAKPKQLALLDVLGEGDGEDGGWGEKTASKLGKTILDRVHQSMILFAAGRNEALKRFLVTEGAGQDQRFWRLAQALSALYPSGTDERRWVEGVMAKKKGLGL